MNNPSNKTIKPVVCHQNMITTAYPKLLSKLTFLIDKDRIRIFETSGKLYINNMNQEICYISSKWSQQLNLT